MSFRVLEKNIPNVAAHSERLLGIVKVQMPEQCEDGTGRIRSAERDRNQQIVRNSIAAFGTWAQRVGAPAIILFPEFSVSEDAADWLCTELATPSIAPNTLIVLGLEETSTERFRERVATSESKAEFADIDFGVNIDRVNTAMILAKDSNHQVTCLYQPKCTRSDYESPRQYRSQTIYQLHFGVHCIIVSICSDFLLRDDRGMVLRSVMEDMEALHLQPADQRLDLILLIQKNPAPLHRLYHQTIRELLFYNRPHRIQTADTIVCAVNSADCSAPHRFGKSNVSVMRRGRPPREYAKRNAYEHFAWCSLASSGDHQNEDLHYVRWRLRGAGAISFVLNTDHRPWPPESLESLPVCQIGLHRLSPEGQLEEILPLPEVFELEETLYADFQEFVAQTFSVHALRLHFSNIEDYQRLIARMFLARPHAILRQLLAIHQVPQNCDHWDLGALSGAFQHFLLSLRLLEHWHPDLRIEQDCLCIAKRRFGIMDCRQRALTEIAEQLKDSRFIEPTVNVLFLQRISNLFPWDGMPAVLDTVIRISSVSRAGPPPPADSVARVPSPQVAHIGTLISKLNLADTSTHALSAFLNENLRFS